MLLGLLLFLDSAPVAVADPGSPPTVVTAPAISGTPRKGGVLTCSAGEWGGNPSTFVWQWSLDGAPIAGATGETYSVLGNDVDHLAGCAVTATNEFGSTTAPSADGDRPHRRSAGPTHTTDSDRPDDRGGGATRDGGCRGIGSVELLGSGAGGTVVMARTKARQARGLQAHGNHPGARARQIPFHPQVRPSRPGALRIHCGQVVVTIVSPRTYPFARSRFERRATLFDHLIPFWQDGRPCSVGCRPAGVDAGWPLRPFREQHPLRSGINELRPSGFHLGIDIQTAGKAHVYAIQSGRAHVIQAHGGDSRVQIGSYIYWHVKLAVREARVHLCLWNGPSERSCTTFAISTCRRWTHRALSQSAPASRPRARPLGGLEPPVIGRSKVGSDGTALVSSFDPQSDVVRTGYVTPVLAPAALAYRLFNIAGNPIGPLEWAFRGTAVLPSELVGSVFAPGGRVAGIPLLRVPRHLHPALALLPGRRPRAEASGARKAVPADGVRLGLGRQHDGARSVAQAVGRKSRLRG